MSTLTTEQLIERATAPGGALAYIREESEAAAAAEEAEADKRREEVAKDLREAESAFIELRDRVWAAQLELADLILDQYEPAEAKLKACQRLARAAGVKVEPTMDKVTQVTTTGTQEDRAGLHRIRTARASGL